MSRMPTDSTNPVVEKTRVFPARLLAMVLSGFALLLGTLAFAGHAAADQPFRIDFDDNEIAIGPISDIPIGQISRGASIEGTVDSRGQVRIPKAKFSLPVLGIDEPVKVRAFMGIENDATGTWDPKTGKLEIQAKAGLWLSIDVAATLAALGGLGIDLGGLGALGPIIGTLAGDLTCGFSPMDVTFTTESTSLGSGQRFTRGLSGPGALATEWSQLGRFAGRTKILGFLDACSTIRGLLPGLVTGLVGNAIPGLDLGGIDIAGLLSNLDSVDLGPSSLRISRAADESVPAQIRMSTGRTSLSARAGQAVRVPVRISNPGDSVARSVRICPRLSPQARVSGSCLGVGSVEPGRTVTRALVIRTKKTARSAGRTGRGRPTRNVRLTIVVTGTGLASQTRGLILRVKG